jgi:TonB family protein
LNSLLKRVLAWVSGTHITVLFLLLLIPLVKSCFHKEPKIIGVFTLSAPPPPLAEVEPEPVPEPEKPKPVPKVEKPVPKPPPTNAPPPKAEAKKPEPRKPAATNVPPKKAETKKPAVTNAPAAKPKTEAEKLAAIRQNNPVKRPVVKSAPAMDFSGIKSALNSASTGSGSTYGSGSGSSGGVYSPFAWYYDRVKQQMYSVWQQPAGAPVGLTATATLRVERDGTVSSKSITRRSGNMPFDQSVQNALSDTVRLPAPPADLPSRTIEIEFALSD